MKSYFKLQNRKTQFLILFSKQLKAQIYTIQITFQVPFSIGDLPICYIGANRHSFDNYRIAVTDTNAQSTKVSIMFTGDTILVNNVGEIEDYGAFFATLQKLRGFNDETLLFQGHQAQKESILFVNQTV